MAQNHSNLSYYIFVTFPSPQTIELEKDMEKNKPENDTSIVLKFACDLRILCFIPSSGQEIEFLRVCKNSQFWITISAICH